MIIEKAKDILMKYSVDVNEMPSDNVSNIITWCHNIVREGKSCSSFSLMMSELRILNNQRCWCELEKDATHQKVLSSILNFSGFYQDDNYIYYSNFIEPQVIEFDDNVYILDDHTTKKLAQMGYGISKMWLEKNEFIKDVYCEGKHPNRNPDSKSFCCGLYVIDRCLNLESLFLIFEMMSCLNLSDCYFAPQEREKILEAIDAKESKS